MTEIHAQMTSVTATWTPVSILAMQKTAETHVVKIVFVQIIPNAD